MDAIFLLRRLNHLNYSLKRPKPRMHPNKVTQIENRQQS